MYHKFCRFFGHSYSSDTVILIEREGDFEKNGRSFLYFVTKILLNERNAVLVPCLDS